MGKSPSERDVGDGLSRAGFEQIAMGGKHPDFMSIPLDLRKVYETMREIA